MRIETYDTTLRDGTQGEGFNLSLHDKLQIALRLDAMGIDWIEGGFPLSNPKDEAFFREIKTYKLAHARISAFGMTRRRGISADQDPGMQALLAAETPAVTIVGKSSPFHATTVLGVSLEENLAMIRESVSFMRSAGRTVFYDAEHFFDAFVQDRAYALATLREAEQSGAEVLCLCDTNGGTMPEQVEQAVRAVREACSARVGIHTHNDAALAVANAISAVGAGATHVQGTINGVGERCGNMDLIPLIANLHLKLKLDMNCAAHLEQLTELSRYVYEIANLNLVASQPYVGSSAFAHKGGMHVHAIQKDSRSYEHIDPARVGNARRVLVSEVSGVSNIAAKAGRKFGITLDREAQRRVLTKVQDLEHAGYQFEAAEASFELLVRKEINLHRSFFELERYRVVTERFGAGGAIAEATVKIVIGTAPEHRVAEGTGPIDSLNRALREALLPHYPRIERVHLVDYKVRVINSNDESAASVRVIIEFRRHREDAPSEYFSTIGVDSNIIDASWRALADAYEYHLLQETE